ncbi:MAG: class I SAM-dependent methyltransferase [Sphingobium sp.]
MRWANDRPTHLAVDALAPGRGDHVLDIGCGPGHGLALLAQRVPQGLIIGVDASETMIAQARKANGRHVAEGRVKLVTGDFDDLRFGPASFDGILASNVIYFWPDPERMIARLKGMLKPGGKLVIYATEAGTMRRWKFATTGTHRWIDREALLAALLEAGFATEEIALNEVRLPANVLGLIAVARAG